MSILKVGALRSPSASSNNIVLNADGTISSGDGGAIPSNNYITGTFSSNNYITGTFSSNNYLQSQLGSFVGAAGVFTNFDAHSDTLTIKNSFNASADYNVGGFTVRSSGVIVPSTGYYDCYVNLISSSMSDYTSIQLRFYIDTTVQSAIADIGGRPSFGRDLSGNLRMILYMTAGQEFRIGTEDSGTEGGSAYVNIAGANSNWIIHKVG